MKDFIQRIISKHAPNSTILSTSPLAGGCINSAVKISTDSTNYFLKWNRDSLLDMFETEANGLEILRSHSALKVPEVFSVGIADDKSYLMTEWIEKGAPNLHFWENFGKNLAKQHRKTERHFGLDHHNYIGSLPQANRPHTSWYDFFIHERLKPQLRLAEQKRLVDASIVQKFDQLFTRLPELIPDESPALLHGDLWSGNFMISDLGEAAVFDPAVHYGHRETELAFTRLFGGFAPEFYASYEDEFPLEPGFQDRIDLHNLYPLLVHVNLFGSSYLSGIIQTLSLHTT